MMIDYKKLAVISIRILAISFLLSGILDLIMVLTSVILVSTDAIPQDAVYHEVWFLQSAVWLIGGAVLYVRSKSLGVAIVESLFGKDDSSETAVESH